MARNQPVLVEGTVAMAAMGIGRLMQQEKPVKDEDLIKRYNELVELVLYEDMLPTMELFLIAFDISEKEAKLWKKGDRGVCRAEVIRKWSTFASAVMIELAGKGKLNPVTWMFYAKNNFGYADKKTVDIVDSTAGKLSAEEQQAIIDNLPKLDTSIKK